MEPAHYTDPLEDALSHASQRVAQVASLVAAMAQVVMQRRALEDARRAAGGDEHGIEPLADQERLLHQQARLAWAPAHDQHWLSQADLTQTAHAWASAAAWADRDPTAASALRKTEQRLRRLHPYAMAYYDRLRGEGTDPLTAMREAAPLFARFPSARPGDPVPQRPALGNATGEGPAHADDQDQGDTQGIQPEPEREDPAEQRGRQIISRLQAQAGAAGRPEPGPDELAMILEATTNLPSTTIDRLTFGAPARSHGNGQRHQAAGAQPAPSSGQPAEASPTRTPGPRTAAQLAAQSFPHTAAEALRAASATRAELAAPSPARTQAPRNTKRPGRSP